MSRLRLVLTVTALVLITGCSMQTVQPWERGKLAEPAMKPQGDPVDAYLDRHIYSSKEAAAGGSGAGGGGCGCN